MEVDFAGVPIGYADPKDCTTPLFDWGDRPSIVFWDVVHILYGMEHGLILDCRADLDCFLRSAHILCLLYFH